MPSPVGLEERKRLETELIQRAWSDEAFRQRLIENPRAVIQETLGAEIPEGIQIKTVEETSDTLFLVLPRAPKRSEELSEEQLEQVAGGASCEGCMCA